MSHHLDSPLARQDVRLDITDLYVFRGSTGTVFVLDVNSTISGDAAPQGFHPEARYEFRVDRSGDAVVDLTYRITFGERDSDGQQDLELRELDGAGSQAEMTGGRVLARGTTNQVTGDGVRLWAGLAADPFSIDPTVLQAVGTAFAHGRAVDLAGWKPADAVDLFAGTSVNTIVLEIPDAALGSGQDIGVWAVTMLATDAGEWRPINRAGRPMIQPIFNPADSEQASDYNTTEPSVDRINYANRFARQVADVVAALGTAADPVAYGARVAELLLPDVLCYRVGSLASFGFAGMNGRDLTDSAPEVMFSLVTNSAFSVGLRGLPGLAPTSAAPFPYVARHRSEVSASV
jgi:Domain of unknown function (DUF4331)